MRLRFFFRLLVSESAQFSLLANQSIRWVNWINVSERTLVPSMYTVCMEQCMYEGPDTNLHDDMYNYRLLSIHDSPYQQVLSAYRTTQSFESKTNVINVNICKL